MTLLIIKNFYKKQIYNYLKEIEITLFSDVTKSFIIFADVLS